MTEYTEVIGKNLIILKDNGYEESNIGDVVTDAFVEAWDDDADMAFINNGGIRSVLVEGNITGEDIFNILPFNNTVDRVLMKGKDIKYKLEGVISGLCPNKTCYSSFWQVSKGIRLVLLIQSHNQGHRIQKFQVPCTKEDPITSWCDLQDDKEYKVVLPSFLATSKHTNILELSSSHEVGMSDYDAFEKYVKDRYTLNEEVDGRIQIEWDTTEHETTTTPKNNAARFFLSYINTVVIALFWIMKCYL